MIIETQGLCFAYGSTPVLIGVNLKIGPGITAIIGPNAAGKSTLLKCLCGLLTPRGRVRLDGHELSRLKAEELTRLVSYLPQELSTRAALTVFEMVLLGRLYQLGLRVRPEDICCVERLLDELGLAALSDRYVSELRVYPNTSVALKRDLAVGCAFSCCDGEHDHAVFIDAS